MGRHISSPVPFRRAGTWTAGADARRAPGAATPGQGAQRPVRLGPRAREPHAGGLGERGVVGRHVRHLPEVCRRVEDSTRGERAQDQARGQRASPDARARRRRWILAALAAMLLGAVTSVGLYARSSVLSAERVHGQGQVTVPGAVSPSVVLPATSPEPQTVEIEIRATPAQAQIFLDGQPVTGNPFKGVYERSAEARKVEIKAPGFIGQSWNVMFDKNRGLSYVSAPQVLEDEARPAVRPRAVVGTRKNRPAAPPIEPRPEPPAEPVTPRRKVQKGIDVVPPWDVSGG